MVYWLAATYAGRGATANAIAPALIAGTAMMPLGPNNAARVPVGRFGSTAETAELAITKLANGYLTGKVFLLDGGIHPR